MLRKRKNKRYNEQTNDEDDGGRRYNLRDKIRSERFEQLGDLQELSGNEVTLKLIQKNGFDKPILVTSPSGLDLCVPPKGFAVRDVGKLVGYDRLIDVMDVRTQKNIEMSMKDWCKYYESRNRDRLLNVISLEFSHTELDSLVDSPKIVKQLDWVDLVWPKFLKESQTESTNTIDKMKYPKVQKYCLMSVKGSYTDFHIDFGGTSVWYHIIRGKKIFWMVPPTELNLQTFEEWTLSGMQQDVFFGDTVEECFRVELSAGNTFFIPSGWIHAVYTLEDSLVFGGNFLHSFGIENQLKVSRIEDATKVPLKFRYPFYTEILWYVVQHYVYCLTGKSHLHDSAKNSATTTPEKVTNAHDTKAGNKRSSAIIDDSATESEQDDSDKAKRKKAASPQPPKRKRGRPPKQKPPPKPPTDDESTEIDSDLEDVKPTKNTTTCRMTKNSLLRLQYEIDEPQVTADRQPNKTSNQQTKSPKDESCSKDKSTTKGKGLSSKPLETSETPIKTEPQQSVDTTIESNVNKTEDSSNLILSHDTTYLNKWPSSNLGGNKAIWSNHDSEPKEPLKIHITKFEVNGLKILVKYLAKLSGAKKNLPTLIRNSRALLDDCKKVIAEHENDDPELAVTGIPVTLELLNPKKSDINQLIEQFFKPCETIASDAASYSNSYIPAKSRSDSSTLTMQQRLKYNQNNNHPKVDDKKIPSTTNDTATPSKATAHKETKCLSPNKKLSSSQSPSFSSATGNTPTASPSADQPRPKSPPTRPLSNKQYTSKTKNDKSGSSLVLPGSFADLIAATSTAKEVFKVSSADVTSSLFGLKSPTKTTQGAKDKDNPNPTKPSRRSPFDIDLTAQATTSNDHTEEAQPQKHHAPKPNSPEPPKISPQKRFITPASNRPQAKEKLIFASAPYVSPVHAQSNPYSWQSSTPIQTSNHTQHQLQPKLKHHPNQGAPTQTQQRNSSRPSTPTPPSNTSLSVVKQPSASKLDPIQWPHRRPNTDAPSSSKPDAPERNQQQSDSSERAAATKSEVPVVTQESTDKPNESSQVKPIDVTGKVETLYRSVEKLNSDAPSQSTKPTDQTVASLPPTTTGDTEQKTKKPHKPRSPPKKSKEARLALESISTEPPRPAVPVSVIRLNTGGQLPVVVQAPAMSQSATMTQGQQAKESNDNAKPKPKRAKKQKEGQAVEKSAMSNPVPGSSQGPTQRPPVICGLVAPPASSTMLSQSAQPPKSGQQQYLISRPFLFNSMPTFSSAHLPHMPTTSMPIFTTPVPTSMGLTNMQPGARIVWATRPRGLPIVTSAPVVNATRPSTTTPQAKKQDPKQAPKQSATPTNLQNRQPDNAALLSLATTALSTAPLPTTPTLSNMGARLPNPTQAYVVNPNLFAAQQYFNPYMQRMSMVQFAPRDTNPAAAIAGAHFRPAGAQRPTGQLLFAPLPNQTGQPRYLITQPGLMTHRPQVSTLFTGHHQPATTLPYAAFQPSVGPGPAKESVKVKKVKTR